MFLADLTVEPVTDMLRDMMLGGFEKLPDFQRVEQRAEGRRERVFEKGDFKYVILDLLQEQPSHGYELIRRLEERFGGRYAPSPGVVYPTLQMLEDMGCVVASQEEGRKVYTITDAGRRFLAERGARVDDIRERMHRWHGEAHHGQHPHPLQMVRELAGFLGGRGRRWDLDEDKARRIGEVVARAKREIEAILAEPPAAGSAAGASRDAAPPPPRRPDFI
jgi:DNA-binding PadR family transcriptional regulator